MSTPTPLMTVLRMFVSVVIAFLTTTIIASGGASQGLPPDSATFETERISLRQDTSETPAESTDVDASADEVPSPEAGQPVTVGETEVTWTGDWQFDFAMEQMVWLEAIDPATDSQKLVTYGEFTEESLDNAETVLEIYTEALFVSEDVNNPEEVDSGELEDGAIWKLYSFDLEGIESSLLITVNEVNDKEFVVSTLTANTDDFEEALAQVQNEIMLDGEPAFLEGVDAEDIGAMVSS